MTQAARPRRWSLARQILALQIAVVGVTVLGATLLAVVQTRSLLADEAAAMARAVAIGVAQSPAVPEALDDPDPSATLQPYAERIRTATGVDFITIMRPDGRRYTHPNPANIGGYFLGNTGPALAQIEKAKAVCRRCTVAEQCLKWAMETNQDAGVWGGLSEDERRSMKRRAARARRAS